MSTNKETLLNLLENNPAPAVIMQIMGESLYDETVCKKGCGLLKSQGWEEEHFLEYLSQGNYKPGFLKASIPYLTLKNLGKEKVLKFLEKNCHNNCLANLAIEVLPLETLSQDELMKLITSFNNERVDNSCWPLINLEGQNEEQLIKLLWQLGSSYQAQLRIAPRLELRKNLLPIIKKLGTGEHGKELRKICFKNLKLEEMDDAELRTLVKESEYDMPVCKEAIKYFKLQSSLWWILATKNYYRPLATRAIKKLEDEDLIMLTVESNITDAKVIIAALPKLSEANIMKIWESCLHKPEIVAAIAVSLPLTGKSENELVSLIVKEEYGDNLCRACEPFLKLETKSRDEVMAFLRKTKYHKGACRTFLPLLKLATTKEEEIFALFKGTGFNENLGEVLMENLSSEKYIMEVVQNKHYGQNTFWSTAFSVMLSSKTDDEIIEIVQKLHNDNKVCKIALNHLKSSSAITGLIILSRYNEEIANIAAEKLKQLKIEKE